MLYSNLNHEISIYIKDITECNITTPFLQRKIYLGIVTVIMRMQKAQVCIITSKDAAEAKQVMQIILIVITLTLSNKQKEKQTTSGTIGQIKLSTNKK